MFNDCLYFNLSSLTRLITDSWKSEFAKLGLSPSHGYLLHAMVESRGEQQKDYGDYLDLEASTVNRLVDALVQKKLIETNGMGRGSQISVTAEGEAVYHHVNETMKNLRRQMNDLLGEDQFEQLVSGLVSARNALVI